MISLITVSLESAHIAAVRANMAIQSDAAVNNTMAHFNRKLYDDYKLLFLMNRDDMDSILKKEIINCKDNSGSFFSGINHVGFKVDSVCVNDKVFLMDKECEAFQKEVNAIVASDAFDILKDILVNDTNKLSQSGKLSKQMNSIMKESGNIEDSVNYIKNASQNINKSNISIDDFKKKINQCESDVKEYKKLLKEDGDKRDITVLENKIKNQLQDIDRYKKTSQREMKEAVNGIDKYQKSVLATGERVKELDKEFKAENLDKEYNKIIEDEVNSILEFSDKSGKDYKKIDNTKENLQRNLDLFNDFNVPKWSDISDVNDSTDGKDLFKPINEKLNSYKTVDSLVTENKKDDSIAKSIGSLLGTVKKLVKNGAFSIVMDDTKNLSKRSIIMDDKPSEAVKKSNSSIVKDIFSQAADNSKDSIMLNMYLYEYMDCYTDSNEYNLEYILGDTISDRENLKSVVNQLVLLRQAMNLTFLFSSPERKSQAHAAAAAMLAVTGNEAIIQGMTFLIMTAWAYAEAVSDVKELVNKGKVEFFKKDSDWRLSLKQAANYKNWGKASSNISSKGMNYKEYLRVLLFFNKRIENIYRGLDIIQWNVSREQKTFKIKNCIFSIGADFKMNSVPIFYSFKGIGNRENLSIQFLHREKKSYG